MQVGDLTSPWPMVAMASLQHFFLAGGCTLFCCPRSFCSFCVLIWPEAYSKIIPLFGSKTVGIASSVQSHYLRFSLDVEPLLGHALSVLIVMSMNYVINCCVFCLSFCALLRNEKFVSLRIVVLQLF